MVLTSVASLSFPPVDRLGRFHGAQVIGLFFHYNSILYVLHFILIYYMLLYVLHIILCITCCHVRVSCRISPLGGGELKDFGGGVA